MAPSIITACAMELPDRIISGASGPNPRSSSACATASAPRVGIAIGDEAPVAEMAALQGRAFGDERALRMLARAGLEEMSDGAVHLSKRIFRAKVTNAPLLLPHVDRRRLHGNRLERRQCRFHLDVHKRPPALPTYRWATFYPISPPAGSEFTNDCAKCPTHHRRRYCRL